MVQGAKSVLELLQSDYEVDQIFVTPQFLDRYELPDGLSNEQVVLANENKVAGLSTFQSNDYAIATARLKEHHEPEEWDQPLIIALDDVRDPGNLGTIIRTADWYNLRYIVASKNTADMYNPKVINATMGSFARVKVVYTDLESFLDRNRQKFEVLGADMDGKSIHKMEIKRPYILVMGNESHGLSQGIMAHINQTVSIPRSGKAESLNVALSTAILCDNIVRQFNG